MLNLILQIFFRSFVTTIRSFVTILGHLLLLGQIETLKPFANDLDVEWVNSPFKTVLTKEHRYHYTHCHMKKSKCVKKFVCKHTFIIIFKSFWLMYQRFILECFPQQKRYPCTTKQFSLHIFHCMSMFKMLHNIIIHGLERREATCTIYT